MGREFSHLTQEDRDNIHIGLMEGKSLRAISRSLKRSPSTILRELARNTTPIRTNNYLPHKGQGRAEERRYLASHRKRLKSPKIKAYGVCQLKRKWSQEMIAGRIRELGWEETTTNGAIYQMSI
jgi:IS30 family transposase